jgi:hypothetical protein
LPEKLAKSRLELFEAARTQLQEHFNALQPHITHDPRGAKAGDYSWFELSHAMLRGNAIFQYLILLRDEPGKPVHEAADEIARRYDDIFAGRTLRAWYADLLAHDGKFSMHGRGQWTREISSVG